MLNTEQQELISKLLRIDKAVLADAIKNEKEVKLDIPEGIESFTGDELKARDENHKKSSYTSGGDARMDIFVKEQKQKLGLEFEGKDPVKLIEAYKDKVLTEAKVEPNAALKEKDTMITNLQRTVQEFEGKYNASEAKVKSITRMGKLVAVVPAGLPVEPNEVIMSMESRGYSFEEDDKGVIIPKKNGEVIRDAKTQNPLEYKAVIDGFITERKWKPAEDPGKQGRGGGSDRRPAASIGSLKEAKEQWQAQGKSINSSEFQAFAEDAAKANKDFNWDEE